MFSYLVVLCIIVILSIRIHNLITSFLSNPSVHNQKEGVETYNVWAAIITEVEIDMLTGEKNILR